MVRVLLLLIIQLLNYQPQEPEPIVEKEFYRLEEKEYMPTRWLYEGQVMRITCYTAPATAHTYSGELVYEGGCAMNVENLGKYAYLYTIDNHELVAKLKINDIGGHPMLKNGTAVDVYMPTYDACWDWVEEYGDHLFVVIREE